MVSAAMGEVTETQILALLVTMDQQLGAVVSDTGVNQE
jgi:hypothetical protein